MNKTIIIGAGLGGLCLAQTLRKAGLDFEVFERDLGPQVRPQGYRLHLDADGAGALAEALSDEAKALFEATSMRPLPYTTLTDVTFRVKRRVPFDQYSGSEHHVRAGVAAHLNVNRATVRDILLRGLEGKVHFGECFTHYERDDGGVTACFESGLRVRGQVLVGADGVRSVVKQQRAPQARTMDTGLRSIYGRVPLERARAVLPGFATADAFTLAADDRRFIMGLGPMVFPIAPQHVSSFSPVRLPACEDYVAFILAGRHELFAPGLRSVGPEPLLTEAKRLLAGWPDGARAVLAAVDVASLFFVEMSTSIPCDFSGEPRVTLLGDALHAMSPSLGRGANIALRDGANLGRQLERHARGEVSLDEALTTYEADMASYGFGVVRQSVETGTRVLGQEPLP